MSWSEPMARHMDVIEKKQSFESFCPAGANTCAKQIISNIDGAIIHILDDVIAGTLELDIAYIHLNVLVYYATQKIDELHPNYSDTTFIGYYKSLFHFLIYGCCLGSAYKDYVVLRPNGQSNAALRYCIDTFIPQMNKSNMRYKYHNTNSNAIIAGITHYLSQLTAHDNIAIEYSIAQYIAEFAAFRFEEFFRKMVAHCAVWALSTSRRKLVSFWHSYHFGRGYVSFIMPSLLTSPQFISIRDANLEYFANEIVFSEGYGVDLRSRIASKSLMLETHVTIKPWTDAETFVDLFERYATNEDALDVTFIYGGNQNDGAIDYRLFEQNLDLLLMHFISSQPRVIHHLFYQTINSLMYFIGDSMKERGKENEQFVNKLIFYIQTYFLPKIDTDQFIKTPKYCHALDALMRTLFDSHTSMMCDEAHEPPRKRVKYG
eukprot:239414_1